MADMSDYLHLGRHLPSLLHVLDPDSSRQPRPHHCHQPLSAVFNPDAAVLANGKANGRPGLVWQHCRGKPTNETAGQQAVGPHGMMIREYNCVFKYQQHHSIKLKYY